MIWITRDREFIDDSQQQKRKDFVIGLQKWVPSVQNNKSGGPNLQTMTTLAGGFLVINYHDAWRKDFKK